MMVGVQTQQAPILKKDLRREIWDRIGQDYKEKISLYILMRIWLKQDVSNVVMHSTYCADVCMDCMII